MATQAREPRSGGHGGAAPTVVGDAHLDPATATALVERINDDTLRILVVPASGAVLVTLGSLLLCVALWKAQSVPRWVPIVGAVSGSTTTRPTRAFGMPFGAGVRRSE